MRISFHGSDEGGALLLAVAAIFILSLLLLSAAPVVSARSALAVRAAESVMERNERSNREIRGKHDLY